MLKNTFYAQKMFLKGTINIPHNIENLKIFMLNEAARH